MLKELSENGLMEHVQSVSKYLKDKLLKMQAKSEKIVEVRGMGLMIGIEINEPVKPLLEKCMAKGLLAIGAGEKVIRLLPPLIMTAKQVDEGIAILEELLI